MEVPAGHGQLVLCGRHPGEPLRTMSRVSRPGPGPWAPGSNGAAAQEDARAAISVWENAREAARQDIWADTVRALEAAAGLTAGQCEEQARWLDEQIRAGYGLPAQGVPARNPGLALDIQVASRARELEEQMPPRPRRMTSRQHAREASDRAEQFLKRLDGEGYGIIAKADRVDRETTSIPELPVLDHDQGGNAASWRPGDPVL
jgi:hypothetical protein